MKKSVAHLTLSVVGVIILYILSTVVQPTHVTLNQIASYEGETVQITGIVTTVHITSSNNQIIGLRNIQTEPIGNLTIFSMEIADVNVDDVVKIKGVVQRYKGEWEVVVHNNNDIKIIDHASPSETGLWKITRNPENYRNLPLSVKGVVEKTKGFSTTFTLTEGDYRITVFSPPQHFFNLTSGDKVKVEGRLLYDDKTFSYYVLAEKVVKLD